MRGKQTGWMLMVLALVFGAGTGCQSQPPREAAPPTRSSSAARPQSSVIHASGELRVTADVLPEVEVGARRTYSLRCASEAKVGSEPITVRASPICRYSPLLSSG